MKAVFAGRLRLELDAQGFRLHDVCHGKKGSPIIHLSPSVLGEFGQSLKPEPFQNGNAVVKFPNGYTLKVTKCKERLPYRLTVGIGAYRMDVRVNGADIETLFKALTGLTCKF